MGHDRIDAISNQHLDENGAPSDFHTTVATALVKLPVVSAERLEQRLVAAGPNHGRHRFQHLRLVPSRLLADLPLRRRQTNDLQELRVWKSNQAEIGMLIETIHNPQNGGFCGQSPLEPVDRCQHVGTSAYKKYWHANGPTVFDKGTLEYD